MKRKAEKQQPAGNSLLVDRYKNTSLRRDILAPVSAVAARKARQQQIQAATAAKASDVELTGEPPSKRPRHLPEQEDSTPRDKESDNARTRRASRRINAPTKSGEGIRRREKSSKSQRVVESSVQDTGDEALSGEEPGANENTAVEANDSDYSVSLQGDIDGYVSPWSCLMHSNACSYESPTDGPAEIQNFPLSKARLNKKNILYSDDHTICIRIREKMVWPNQTKGALY